MINQPFTSHLTPQIVAYFTEQRHQLEDMCVDVIKAGLSDKPKQRKRGKEMPFIYKFETLDLAKLIKDITFL